MHNDPSIFSLNALQLYHLFVRKRQTCHLGYQVIYIYTLSKRTSYWCIHYRKFEVFPRKQCRFRWWLLPTNRSHRHGKKSCSCFCMFDYRLLRRKQTLHYCFTHVFHPWIVYLDRYPPQTLCGRWFPATSQFNQYWKYHQLSQYSLPSNKSYIRESNFWEY